MLAPWKRLKLVRVLLAASSVVAFAWASPGCAEGGEATTKRPDAGGGRAGDASAGKGGSVDGGGGDGQGGAAATDGGPPAACGNGVQEPGEYCDDGNLDETDGCKSDCSQSCMPGPDGDQSCTDYIFCNGPEVCQTNGTCGPSTSMPDGTLCGQNKHCQNGTCTDTPTVCGDGLIIRPEEECDDGNTYDNDGCDSNCLWTCESMDIRACAPPDPCQQNGTCDDITHLCTPGATLPDGIDCDVGKVCRGGTCTTITCGNGMPDAGEECDDMNTTPDDGCESNSQVHVLVDGHARETARSWIPVRGRAPATTRPTGARRRRRFPPMPRAARGATARRAFALWPSAETPSSNRVRTATRVSRTHPMIGTAAQSVAGSAARQLRTATMATRAPTTSAGRTTSARTRPIRP